MQEVQRDSAADFEAFMLDSMERAWAADKARLAAGLGLSVGTFGSRPAAPGTPGGDAAAAAAASTAAAASASPFDLAAGGGGPATSM